ncbi:MAG: hypothetical protein ABI867_20670 [Kofleriaceae bacterium]
MVARTAARGFSPAATPIIAVAGDGAFAAIVEPGRVVVVDLPSGTPHAEVGLDASAVASDVGWLGSRLLVLARHAGHSRAHLIDVRGEAPRSIAEIRLETAMRLVATIGNHALIVGGTGSAVLTALEAALQPYQFMSRVQPTAAGAAGTQFVVAVPGVLEEWDPASRMPKRRLRLPRPATITAVGGSDRVVWMTTQADPTRIDVLPLVNRGQPKHHELAEPITAVYGHPRSDLIACLGAHALYIVDLDGRTRTRTITADGIDQIEAAALVTGRMTGVIVAQAERPIATISFDGREPEPEPLPPKRAPRREVDPEPPKPSSLVEEPYEPLPDEPPSLPPAHEDAELLPPPPPVAPAPRVPWAAGPHNLSDRFSALRDRGPKPRSDAPASKSSWRDDLAQWARTISAGAHDKAPPACPPVDVLATRLELSSITPALVLLYGLHLVGVHGGAPVDVARVLGRSWDEALGRGKLAAYGLATYEGSRVILVEPILRALDELPPVTGTLVGTPGASALLGPCAVIGGRASRLAIAQRHAARVGGAILVADPTANPVEAVIEARVYGAVALLDALAGDAAVLVAVTDDAHAEQLGIPILEG